MISFQIHISDLPEDLAKQNARLKRAKLGHEKADHLTKSQVRPTLLVKGPPLRAAAQEYRTLG